MNVFELEASLKLNTSEYDRSLKNSEKSAKDFDKTLDKMEDATSDLSDAFSDAGEDIEDSLEDLADSAEETASTISESFSDVAIDESISDSCDDASSELGEVADSAEESASEVESAFDGVSVDVDTSPAQESIGSVGDEMDGINSVAGLLPGSMSSAVGGMVGAIAGGGIIDAIGGMVSSIGEVITQSGEMAREWAGAVDDMIVSAGVYDEELEILTDAMDGVYAGSKNLGKTPEEVGAIVGEIRTKFGSLNEIDLETLGTKILDVSGLFNEDAVGLIDSLYTTTEYYGEAAGNTSDILDKLTLASQNSGIGVGDLSEAMNKNKAVFDALGMSYDEGLNFLASYGKETGSVSEATRTLNKVYDNLGDTVHGGYIFESAIEGAGKFNSVAEAMNSTISTTGMTYADVFGDNKMGRAMVQALSTGKVAMEGFTDGYKGNLSNTVEETTDFVDRHDLLMMELEKNMSDTTGKVMNDYYSWDNQLLQVKNQSADTADGFDNALYRMVNSSAYTNDVANAFQTFSANSQQSVEGLIYYLSRGGAEAEETISHMSEMYGVSVEDINKAIAEYEEGLYGYHDVAQETNNRVIEMQKGTTDKIEKYQQAQYKSAQDAANKTKSSASNMASSVSSSASTAINWWDKMKGAVSRMADTVRANSNLRMDVHGSYPVATWKTVNGQQVVDSVTKVQFAKAMNRAALFSTSTEFAPNMIAGEAGNELLTGEQHLNATVEKAVSKALNNQLTGIYALLSKFLPQCAQNRDLYVDGKRMADALTNDIANNMARKTKLTNMIKGARA